jgi:hypothetical protein
MSETETCTDVLICTRCEEPVAGGENWGDERRPLHEACYRAAVDAGWSDWWDRVFHEARDEGRR